MTQLLEYRRTQASAKPRMVVDETRRWTSLDTARRRVDQRQEEASRIAWRAAFKRAELAFPLKRPSRPRFDTIVRRICKSFGITRQQLITKCRKQKSVLARSAVAYWAGRLCPEMSLPQIGRLLGGQDHTTVLHSQRAYVEKRARKNRHLRPIR